MQNKNNTKQPVMEGLPGGSVAKNLPASAGEVDSIPDLGRSPGEGNGNPFQYSCLENAMDRGAWQATAHAISQSDMIVRQTFHFSHI